MWYSVFIFILSIIVWIFFRKPKDNLPPGPPKLPLIGSLITVMRAGPSRPSLAFQKLAKTYGAIFHIQMGSISAVVINDYKTILEVSCRDEFLNRTTEKEIWLTQKSYGLPLGVAFSRQSFSAPTRAFIHKLLNKYGFDNKSFLEDLVLKGIEQFIARFKEKLTSSSGVVCIDKQFNVIFFYTIWTLFTSERLNVDDPIIKKLLEASDNYIKSAKFGGGIATLYPSLVHYFPGFTGFTEMKRMSKEFCGVLESLLAERRLKEFYKTEPRCFIDDFLHEIERNKNLSDNPMNTVFTDMNLVTILQDIIMAGNDTQFATLKFAVQYFVIYPEVQVRLREEIDRIVGRSQVISTNHIPSLLYTQAVLYEIHRFTAVVPLMPRIPSVNSHIGGYDIPKDTHVLCNFWSANHEESVWENPYDFKPERFLGENCIKNASKILSFGSGKRRCLGEQLSKFNMIFVMVSLIQHFEFEVDPASGLPDPNDDTHGLVRNALPFNISIKIRN